MLECANVSCTRNNRILFRDLSFTTKNGSLILITGGNGSGKTTLLRAMVGLVPLASGSITLYEEDITSYSSCISQITYVGHKNACSPNMMVEDILEFWGECKGTSELVYAALCFFGLNPVLGARFKNLSSGWQRRVALSRLLISNTRVWIVDEPFANLDSETVTLIQNLILTRVERGGIVILADHSANPAFRDAQVIRIPTTTSKAYKLRNTAT
ncbi:MAG: heme ABC exporter ATP-binding protein CcmA [Anaplasma sp.]